MFEGDLGSTAPRSTLSGADHYRPGQIIDGRFLVKEKLGVGGMGTVLKVVDQDANRLRALKYCHKTGERKQRFEREVRIMQRVSHPHVVLIYHANLEYDPPYFVMPIASGCLGDEIDNLKLDETAALLAFKQACFGIQALHAAGAVHRDLKPHNLLRFKHWDNRVVVSDLGLAKLEERDTTALTHTTDKLGTYEYAAPEQFIDGGTRECDARTDIFQLGRLLYHFVTGKSPLAVDLNQLPRGLDHIVRKATNQIPEHRYRSAGQILDALTQYETAKKQTDSRAAFESMIQEAEDLFVEGKIKGDNLEAVLTFIAQIDPGDHRTILADFHRIPNGLLQIVGLDYSAHLLPVLRLYTEAIRARVSSQYFAYADGVASRMLEIFVHSKDTEIQSLALQSILIAAVELNRFNAMGIFSKLLVSVQDIGLALPIADMLQADAEYYKVLAGNPPRESLHPAIRAVRDELLKPTADPDDDDDIPF